eukprot:15465145-Alexandrium_andersonii.AAC.1
MAAHSWERDWEATSAFSEGAPAASDSEESDAEDELAEGAEAGAMFMDYVLDLYYAGRMTAKAVCVLSWWGTRAGMAGPAKDFAYRPSAQSGQFQAKMNRALGVEVDNTKYCMVE